MTGPIAHERATTELRSQPSHDVVFYDGDCGLCHAFVRFLCARPGAIDRFRFAPLDGETAASTLLPRAPSPLPDSVAIVTREGAVLFRFEGVRHVIALLPGNWRFASLILQLVPRPLGDLAYRAIARVRRAVFGKTEDACPVVPESLAQAFLP